MSNSIPISQLNQLSVVSFNDYIPIVQNSTTTTFNTRLLSLSNWISASVQASSSVSTVSSSYSLSSSWANNSSASITSNNLVYPNTSTASFAQNSNISVSASFASQSISSSWAKISTSASWAPATTTVNTASYALQAGSASWAPLQISASWASASLSSSFLKGTASGSVVNGVSFNGTSSWSVSSSYAANIPVSNIKAFASFVMAANFVNTPPPRNIITMLNSFNISSIVINYGQIDTWTANNVYYFTVNFITPTSNLNYIAIGNAGERGSNIESYHFSAPPNYTGQQSDTISIPFRTTSSFSFVLDSSGADRTSGENAYCHFVVFG